jgi:glycosyltransferase involved in cell wall biosynthesis
MKVTFVNYYYDKDISIEEYFDKYPAVHGWAKALRDKGLDVKVYHRFSQNKILVKDDVEYIFVNDKFRSDLKWHQNPVSFHNKICEGKHEIIHVNSFIYSYQASLLKKQLPSARLVIQHHAEKPGHWIKRFLVRNFSSLADGFIFSSTELYDEWLKTKTLPEGKKFAEIMEGSSDFIFRNRDEVRFKTGLTGKPIFLWVGRLNENKDPVTVLSGFIKILKDFPEAKLYLIYSDDNLKSELLSFIEQDVAIKNSVILLGFIPHKKISDYYNSADYFVLGSHYEGSGFSLVEAMSCGVVPIVTDIPAFRMITDNGRIGGLWKCSDAESFYTKAKEIIKKPIEAESKKTFDFFSSNLSYAAIGSKVKIFYESLVTGN